MTRVLVTGGAGFLGSHLCRKLLNEGAGVICLDNFYTGSERNIIEHAANPNFTKVCHDVATPLKLEVEQIFNLACPASPVHYQQDPVRTVKTSVLCAINMLDMATASNSRILQA
ncbi:MAG: NAD-dependent epimerase/dehydratase family protein, partial [Pseudomonadota bacterium]|nr:NAD-dependent epimerase/dehydratase family protein [Pseudomonadota bacterium]